MKRTCGAVVQVGSVGIIRVCLSVFSEDVLCADSAFVTIQPEGRHKTVFYGHDLKKHGRLCIIRLSIDNNMQINAHESAIWGRSLAGASRY